MRRTVRSRAEPCGLLSGWVWGALTVRRWAVARCGAVACHGEPLGLLLCACIGQGVAVWLCSGGREWGRGEGDVMRDPLSAKNNEKFYINYEGIIKAWTPEAQCQ